MSLGNTKNHPYDTFSFKVTKALPFSKSNKKTQDKFLKLLKKTNCGFCVALLISGKKKTTKEEKEKGFVRARGEKKREERSRIMKCK